MKYDEVVRERDALAYAIRKAAVDSGICAPEAQPSGPQLIMLCADMAASIARHRQRRRPDYVASIDA